MTEDDTNADEIRSQESLRDAPDGVDADWEDVSTDPDPQVLGYEREQWERISAANSDQIVFLPSNEEDIADDAFVVLDESDLTDLVSRR